MTDTAPNLQPLFETLERRMYLDIYRAMPEEVARRCGFSWAEDGSALRLSCRTTNHPFFNRVTGLPGGGRDVEEWVDEVAAHYEGCGVSRWMLQVVPGELTPETIEIFESRGLVSVRGWAKHAGALRQVVPPPAAERCDLRIERIGADWARDWALVLGPAFGYPEDAFAWPAATVGRPVWSHYGAFDGDELVATAALYVAGGIGTLNFASTKESHRRRGAQSALIARRIRDARRMGLHWLVTETDEELPDRPNPSYHNVVRAGMAVQYVRANWGPPPP